MFADYYIVRRGYIEVGHLYTFSKESNAHYTAGINWRAYTA